MSITNIYYKRTTATAKPCYVCYKPTTTVLATLNMTDFLYTCPSHLADPGFSTSLGETGSAGGAPGSSKRLGLSAEEIQKVKEEWEEKQRNKKPKDKDKEKEDEKVKKTDGKDEKDKSKKDADAKKPTPVDTPSSDAAPRPTHERYALHRDFFAMRLREHRKQRQTAQAKDLAPRLPSPPQGTTYKSF